MKRLLELEKLSKKYHDQNGEIEAVKDISLSIYDKEIIAVVGPSGCGKSTMLSILANLEDKSSGKIKFNKDNLKIGYMLQKDALFPWLTILENCLLGLKIQKKLNPETYKRVNNLLDKYGLKEFKNKYPSSLSGGMKQRTL